MSYTRHHSSDDMTGPEFANVTEPVAVVIRPDGSADVYGYVAVIDQRPEDTDSDPAAQAERDRLMPQSCGECGGEVSEDGAEPDHLDDCPHFEIDGSMAKEDRRNAWQLEVTAGGTVYGAVSNLVRYNWADEERDYNTGALEPGNSREGHIFGDLMLIQRWLETFGYPHVQPFITPEDTSTARWFAESKAAGCTGTGYDTDHDTIEHRNPGPCPVHPGLPD